MASSVQSPEDVINIALVRIGLKSRVSNIMDGSAAAKKALDIYGQTRDSVLRSREWGFAKKITNAQLSGYTPPAPWTVEYAYPDDCIKIRSMWGGVYLTDQNNPLPVLYEVGLSASGGKAIWSKTAGLELAYTSRVTNPLLWEDPQFVEILVSMLAKQLAVALTDANMAKMAIEDGKAATDAAETDQE